MRLTKSFFYYIFIKNQIIFKSYFFLFLNFDFFLKLFLFFRFLKNQKNLFFFYNSFLLFKVTQKFFKFFFFSNKLQDNFFFFTKTFINFKLKVGFFKKFNKLRSFYFYKYWRLNKKFKKTKLSLKKNFSKNFDLKKKIFFLLKENRSIISNLFFSKFTRQKKITFFLSKFKHFSIKKIVKFFEFSLFNILIQSHLLIFKKDIDYFFKNGFIFVNGIVVFNKFFFLNVGDRVQISISNQYYFFFRNFSKVLKSFNYKIRLSMRKIFLKRKDFYKQKSNKTPAWVDKIIFSKQVIPKYLEVDFFTLTCVIIRNTNNFFENNLIFLKFLSYFNIRLYNWKKLN